MHHIKNWAVPTELSPPAAKQLHLWRIDLTESDEELETVLSEDEQARARRFHSTQDRTRFIKARGAMRLLLGCYLATAPEELVFVYGPRGKPFIASPASVLSFNLIHTGDMALLGVSREAAIGIDLEQVREKPNFHAIARRVFSTAIVQALSQLEGAALAEAFFKHWTEHEARMKAIGNGIFSQHNPSRDAELPALHFIPEEGYLAAVVMEGAPPSFEAWQTYLFE